MIYFRSFVVVLLVFLCRESKALEVQIEAPDLIPYNQRLTVVPNTIFAGFQSGEIIEHRPITVYTMNPSYVGYGTLSVPESQLQDHPILGPVKEVTFMAAFLCAPVVIPKNGSGNWQASVTVTGGKTGACADSSQAVRRRSIPEGPASFDTPAWQEGNTKAKSKAMRAALIGLGLTPTETDSLCQGTCSDSSEMCAPIELISDDEDGVEKKKKEDKREVMENGQVVEVSFNPPRYYYNFTILAAGGASWYDGNGGGSSGPGSSGPGSSNPPTSGGGGSTPPQPPIPTDLFLSVYCGCVSKD